MTATPQDASLPHVVVLGAGPAGVGAAYELTRAGRARVTVLEQRDTVGGNAGSFQLDGVWVDYGSHRLHPACDPAILSNLREIMGDDLLDRPRHGRIRIENRWIHFPLKPGDLLLRMPKKFAFGVALDMVRKPSAMNGSPDSFASVLEHSLGSTICHGFYFPYARKLWGLPPEELAATQARRRVSGNSVGKILRKVANAVPGLKRPGAGRFFYPRRGYGQISQHLCEAAQSAGAQFIMQARVTALEREGESIAAVLYEADGQSHRIPTRNVWSTLPISLLVRSMSPEAPRDVLAAATGISFRGMILIYLTLEQDQLQRIRRALFSRGVDSHLATVGAQELPRLERAARHNGVVRGVAFRSGFSGMGDDGRAIGRLALRMARAGKSAG